MPPTAPPSLSQLLPLAVAVVLMILMFYYTLIVPAKKRQKTHQTLVETIKEGDEVVTAGGIYGKITKLRDEWIELEVAQGVRIKFDRRAIRRRSGELS